MIIAKFRARIREAREAQNLPLREGLKENIEMDKNLIYE